MSLTLKDNLCIRWVERTVDPDANPAYEDNVTLRSRHRPASLADLVEVLKQEGAEEVTVGVRKDRFVPAIYVGAGRYLVLPLEDTK